MKRFCTTIMEAPVLQNIVLDGFVGDRSIFDGIVGCTISLK